MPTFIVRINKHIHLPVNNILDEECRLLGCGAVYILCEPTFRSNVGSHKTYMVAYPRRRHSSVTAIKTSNLTIFTFIYYSNITLTPCRVNAQTSYVLSRVIDSAVNSCLYVYGKLIFFTNFRLMDVIQSKTNFLIGRMVKNAD
jgi:hypothetical protein